MLEYKVSSFFIFGVGGEAPEAEVDECFGLGGGLSRLRTKRAMVRVCPPHLTLLGSVNRQL